MEDCVECKLCGTIHNKFSFNLHLIKKHQIRDYQEYYVLTELNGVYPICNCGFCQEKPAFDYRGKKFREIKFGHDEFEYLQKSYIKKKGFPICPSCNKKYNKFFRGKPNKYCSFKCSGNQNGFSKPETQKKIKSVVLERYGVDNVAKVAEIAAKSGKASGIANTGQKRSEKRKKQISKASKEMWERPGYREMMAIKLKEALNRPEERRKRSIRAIERMEKDPLFMEKFSKFTSRLSKPHQRIRESLKLDSLGFKSEQRIGRYTVDELNEEKKIIIEVYGDYFHANPKKFSAQDEIRIKKGKLLYTAQEKWDKDSLRVKNLENLGYTVIVIWESDDLEYFKQLLNNLLVI